MSLPETIRAELSSTHIAIEQTPFAQALVGGELRRPAYGVALSELLPMHLALESALIANADAVPMYNAAEMDRSGAIERDLLVLGYTGAPGLDATRSLIECFQHWAGVTPWKLIGALYVFEGSRMGSMAIARPLAKGLSLEARAGNGLDYHLDGAATRPMMWGRFKAELAALPLSDEHKADVVAAAIQTMRGLHAIYAGLPTVSETVAV